MSENNTVMHDSLCEEAADANFLRAECRCKERTIATENATLRARLAEAETLLEIVAPLAYAQWKSGSCDPVEAVVSPNEPVTGNADSATGATNAKP